MKRVLVIAVLMFLALSTFAYAESGSGSDGSGGSGDDDSDDDSSDDSQTEESADEQDDSSDDSSSSGRGSGDEARNRIRAESRLEIKDEEFRNRAEVKIEMRDEKGRIERRFEEKIRIIENGVAKEIIREHRIKIREDGRVEEIIKEKIKIKSEIGLFADDNSSNKSILKANLSNGRFAEIKVMPETASRIALERMKAKCAERNCTLVIKEVGDGNETKAAYEIEGEKEARVLFFVKNKMKIKAVVDAESGEVVSVKKPWWAFFADEKEATEDEINQDLGTNETMSDPAEETSGLETETNISETQ